MNTHRRSRSGLAALALASTALFVAAGGPGHAGSLITGKQVKNASLTGKDLRDSSLTGLDLLDGSVTSADVAGLTQADIAPDSLDGASIDESRLDIVPYAYDAQTSARLGNLKPGDVMLRGGCERGKVLGFAQVRGDDGSMPSAYTTAVTYVNATENCADAPVQVRRIAVGQYRVKFVDNPAYIAVAQVRTETDSTDADLCFGLRKESAPGIDLNAFAVTVTTCDGTSTARDANFTLLLP